MKKDWKYLLYVATALGLFIAVKLVSPVPYNWTLTFAHEDKNPYGAYALGRLLPAMFAGDVHHSYKTLYELRDSLPPNGSAVVIASTFNGGKEDADVLLRHVAQGGSAIISAQYFNGHFADTLGISTYDYFFDSPDFPGSRDSSTLKFANPAQDTSAVYFYRRDNIHDYFNRFDTARTTVVATNEANLPVTIRVTWGKGNLILNCTPLIFTNIYLLSGNHEFPAGMLSYLPRTPIIWTEFYQVGRMEIGTPLRFILTTEPLRWGYYLAIFTILLFIVFEVKRKQRIIPVIQPLRNTTLEFVRTIGELYFQRADHKNIAEKKIHFLMDSIRSTYWIDTRSMDKQFVRALAAKTAKSEKEIDELVSAILDIQHKDKVSEQDLIEFNGKVERFSGVTQHVG